MSAQRSEEVLRMYLDRIVSNGELDLVDEITHEDMVDHGVVALGGPAGRAGFLLHIQYFRTSFPDADITINHVTAGENEVAALWELRGTHSSNFFGVDPTNKKIVGNAASFFSLRDGKITDYRYLVDEAGFLRQVGALSA